MNATLRRTLPWTGLSGLLGTPLTNLCAPKYYGMGLLDLMLAMIIVALLAAVAIPAYGNFVDRARITRAIGDIGSISNEYGPLAHRSDLRRSQDVTEHASASRLDVDKRLCKGTQGKQFPRHCAQHVAASRYSSGIYATGNHRNDGGAKQGLRS